MYVKVMRISLDLCEMASHMISLLVVEWSLRIEPIYSFVSLKTSFASFFQNQPTFNRGIFYIYAPTGSVNLFYLLLFHDFPAENKLCSPKNSSRFYVFSSGNPKTAHGFRLFVYLCLFYRCFTLCTCFDRFFNLYSTVCLALLSVSTTVLRGFHHSFHP